MTPDTQPGLTRRTAIKAAAAALVLAAGTAAGLARAARPGTDAHVEFASTTGLLSPRGAAVQVTATLPEGGFIAVYAGGSVDGEALIGVNEPALGRGRFRNMLIEVAVPGPGTHELTAAVFKDDGDRRFGDGDGAYDAAPATEEITF